MDQYQNFIALSRYARWMEEKGRRETWSETVQRYKEFFTPRVPEGFEADWDAAMEGVRGLGVMPSMRCLMTAGKALERDNMAGFNCSFIAIDHPRAFDELMYVLMCGTGVGFSVERQFIAKLPEVAHEFYATDTVIVVKDSKIGWASAFRELISLLYAGRIPEYDLANVRPAGARLKTFGGRASGPAPLKSLFDFTIKLFKDAAGRRLNSLEVHDLVCKIAEIVVVGGVRRSALISLSNLSDDRMRRAKSGNWWEHDPQRALANNSACYTEKPDLEAFMQEWMALYESKSGERGIFSRTASQKQAAKNGRRDANHDFGTNPCSEIILRSCQVCNLSEVVVRAEDTLETLIEKVKHATILGTLQSTLVDFRYLRPIWRQNTEEECLLGVSMTGIMDNEITAGKDPETLKKWLETLRDVAITTNAEWADAMGINRSTAITCVKPSGTVSQLVDSASGIHPRYAPYYIRRVRADVKDPLAQFMKDKGFPCEQDVITASNLVFSFPMKAPEGAQCTNDVGTMEQLHLWKIYQDHWCEHKPSVTVYYTDETFLDAGAWLWKNFDSVSGISFLPYFENTYQQAPYEEIDAETYAEMAATMPTGVDWGGLGSYELEDTTTGTQTLACVAGNCEL